MRFLVLASILAAACNTPVAGTTAEDLPAATPSTACKPAEVVEGVDLSDGQGDVDWTSAYNDGIRFAIVKATQGTYNTQSTFAGHWKAMKAAGVMRSAYHFFDPTEDGVAQANHFLAVAGDMVPGDLPPTLDIECPDTDDKCLGWAGGTGDASASAIQQRMNDFLTTVQNATGRMPMVYTFETYFASNGVSTTGLQTYPLYIADPTTSNCFGVPSPWSAATIWQYSFEGSVSGISGGVDRDRFLGDMTALEAFAGGTSNGNGSGSDTGSGSGSGSGTTNGANGCNSATLAAQVPSGTCVQSAADGDWYTCDDGSWVSGENDCTATYAWCESPTLGKSVAPRTCVQSESNSEWYQCDAAGWDTPVSDGAGPIGACSAQYPL